MVVSLIKFNEIGERLFDEHDKRGIKYINKFVNKYQTATCLFNKLYLPKEE